MTKEDDVFNTDGIPRMFIKCPVCGEIIYRRDAIYTNKCPNAGCAYAFPYPFAKLDEVERKIDSKESLADLGELIVKILDEIDDANQKKAIMSEIIRLVQTQIKVEFNTAKMMNDFKQKR